MSIRRCRLPVAATNLAAWICPAAAAFPLPIAGPALWNAFATLVLRHSARWATSLAVN